ncbi:hypothetical protein BDC45DRAFT_571569 [Circinella umbellata]|nr:hypothetical protein BDC45DRAFT_571569 [Circinella umbellata]
MDLLFNKGSHNIESLEFAQCTMPDNVGLIQLLQHQELIHLTELKLIHHFANVSFLSLLRACPNLTHFTYTASSIAYNNGLYDQIPVVNVSSPLKNEPLPPVIHHNTFSCLTYLNIDAIMDKRIRLEPILHKCPNLQYLLYANGYAENHFASYDTTIINLDDLFSMWCPKLIFLQMNSPLPPFLENSPWQQEYIRMEDIILISKTGLNATKEKCQEKGLRYLIIGEKQSFGPDQVIPHFRRNHATLEYVSISSYYQQPNLVNWSPMFMSNPNDQLVFLQLRILICDRILIENAPLVSLLRRCPKLEHLAVKVVHNSSIDLLDILQFGSRQLKRINLDTIKAQEEPQQSINNNNSNNDSNNNDDNKQRQRQRQQHFSNLSTRGCQIEYIRLFKVYNVTSTLLEGIAELKTIQHLDITFSPLSVASNYETDNHDGFSRFAEMLHKTRIKSLELAQVAFVSYATLVAFGNLGTLENLRIRRSKIGKTLQVHGNGLVQMMNTTRSLKYVYFDNLQLFGNDHGSNDGDDNGLDFLNKEIHRYKAIKKDRSRTANRNTVILEPIE